MPDTSLEPTTAAAGLDAVNYDENSIKTPTANMPRTSVSLVGRTFGLLSPVRILRRNRFHNAIWECQCACGNTCEVLYQNLTQGSVSSCGCKRKQKAPD